MNQKIDSFQELYRNRIQDLLSQHLHFAQSSSRLDEALRYSVMNGGKRIRPLLIYAVALDLKLAPELVDAAALAIELIHCYSLIHDDLPAMDDDDLRRGKATCHIAFDEATAILAGDALQSLAFQILSTPHAKLTPPIQMTMIHCLSQAIGPEGMAAGQMLDLQAENKQIPLDELEKIHRFKTGALISACLRLAGLAADRPINELENLTKIGFHLGLAFQIQDDILDVEGSTASLGKASGADAALNKSTYPKLLGLETAQLKFHEEYQKARSLIEQNIPESIYLNGMVEMMFGRDF
jgi:farnesyl diphosphate synthase